MWLIIFVSPTVRGIGYQSIALDLIVTEEPGSITIETDDWKLVFDEDYNWGLTQWYDKRATNPSDNLGSDQNGASAGGYSQGALFDYDIYLGIPGGQSNEFMTTMGPNALPGAAQLQVIENSPARVRLRQSGHPRLNNGRGPVGDSFVELELIDFVTQWTIYPTGEIYVDFVTTINDTERVVTSGSGGEQRAINVSGNTVTGINGVDFVAEGVFEGDTIESTSGAFGPVQINSRSSATSLILDSSISGDPSAVDFLVRRDNIKLETISLHADGDPSGLGFSSQWQGGSNTDVVWEEATSTSTLRHYDASQVQYDYVLAHWARIRDAGALLAGFEYWTEARFGAFNDLDFKDLSFTQWGYANGPRPIPTHDRHYLVHIGSTAASSELPNIKSVEDSLPIADDYVTPYANPIAGSLLEGATIYDGFNPEYGQYEIVADFGEAIIEFDSNGVAPSTATRTGVAYISPVIRISNTPEFSLMNIELSTDMGSTYSSVPTADYNLVRLSDGSWLFHYLEEVPVTSTGSSSWRFRFTPATLSGLWVDFDHTGIEAGTFDLPFDTLAEGVSAASSGATVNIVSGSTSETSTISNPMTLVASGGMVTIGVSL